MNRPVRLPRYCAALSALAFICLAAPAVHAQENNSSADAARHFARGVALYDEADYRAAVVEFERAYATVPNLAVLYDIGEAEYQMKAYAGALVTFERYLNDAPPADARRAEVAADVEVLRTRVGHLSITTLPPGAEVTVDGRAIGRTPLDKPVLVSVGRREVVASLPGRPPVVRDVDVAADDQTAVVLDLPSSDAGATETATSAAPAPAAPEAQRTPAAPESSGGSTLRALGWLVTGASAAGAATFGVLTLRASSDLSRARDAYPTSAATLSHDAAVVRAYSIAADSLAAAAIVVGGVTLYSTVSSPSARESGSIGTARVSIGPASARFEMTF
jgi:hypothetical protein